MARMYTLDNKLLCGSPEIRIGEKVYPIDDRKNTVKKMMKLFEDNKKRGGDDFEKTEEALKLAFGNRYSEIEALDMPFSAYQQLIQLVIAAMTGEDPEKPKKDDQGDSFRS